MKRNNFEWLKNDSYTDKLKRDNKGKYIYRGNERVETDEQSYVEIHWNDGTSTCSICDERDTFNFGYGLLISTAKKFVRGLDLDILELQCRDVNQEETMLNMIYILELLVLNTAGRRCLNDIHNEVKQFGQRRKVISKQEQEILKAIRDIVKTCGPNSKIVKSIFKTMYR